MKYIIVIIILYILFAAQGCGLPNAYRTSEEQLLNNMDHGQLLCWGNEIILRFETKNGPLVKKINRFNSKSKNFGIIITGVGTVGGTVTAAIDNSNTAKWAGVGFSVTSAVLGVIQLLNTPNRKAHEYLKEYNPIKEKWDSIVLNSPITTDEFRQWQQQLHDFLSEYHDVVQINTSYPSTCL